MSADSNQATHEQLAELSPHIVAALHLTTEVISEVLGIPRDAIPDTRQSILGGIIAQVGGALIGDRVETGFNREDLLNEVEAVAKDLLDRVRALPM